ncbi:hypothetical protein JUNP479_3213 [Aeromonas jandaei]|nr:hypothetical protein JUNP479_3213 [Aeromonas jandaei]
MVDKTMSNKDKVKNINYEHFLSAIDTPYDGKMQDHRGNPLINTRTNVLYNKKEVFRRAYKLANNESWNTKEKHNDISRDCIQRLISGHAEWRLNDHW